MWLLATARGYPWLTCGDAPGRSGAGVDGVQKVFCVLEYLEYEITGILARIRVIPVRGTLVL